MKKSTYCLPYLPNLGDGMINGLCARGGFEIAISWRNRQLQVIQVLSKQGNACILNKVIKSRKSKQGKYTGLTRTLNY